MVPNRATHHICRSLTYSKYIFVTFAVKLFSWDRDLRYLRLTALKFIFFADAKMLDFGTEKPEGSMIYENLNVCLFH